jgi:hypothetical protein
MVVDSENGATHKCDKPARAKSLRDMTGKPEKELECLNLDM